MGRQAIVWLNRRRINREGPGGIIGALRRIAELAWGEHGRAAIVVVVVSSRVYYIVFPAHTHLGARYHEDRSGASVKAGHVDSGWQNCEVIAIEDPRGRLAVAIARTACSEGRAPTWKAKPSGFVHRDSFDVPGGYPYEIVNDSTGVAILEVVAESGQRVDTHALATSERNSFPVDGHPALLKLHAAFTQPAY